MCMVTGFCVNCVKLTLRAHALCAQAQATGNAGLRGSRQQGRRGQLSSNKQAAAVLPKERQHPTPTVPCSAANVLSKSIAGSAAQPEMFVPQPQQVCSC